MLGSCNTCECAVPLCSNCIQERSEAWSSSARAFGWRWGARLRITMDVGGTASKSWPAWDSDAAVNVRRISRKIVEPLAGATPERRDARLVEIFAQMCAAAAREAFLELTLEEARLVVVDWDRRFPNWQADLILRLRGQAS